MSNLNRDVKTRDRIVFGKEIDPKSYSTKNFDNLPLQNLKQLFKAHFIEPEDQYNDSPTAKEILDFITENPNFTANGYVVSIDRSDYRTTLTGVNHNSIPLTTPELINFSNEFHNADEFDAGKGYAWYD